MSISSISSQQLARGAERFRAAARVLRDVNEWLARQGADPPLCVIERMEHHQMTVEQYYQWWKSFKFLDPRQQDEMHAIEDSAIHKVQPEWVRRPDK